MSIHPVLLCGGSGTRLWPLSRAVYPKQLVPLTSELSLLQQTALRFRGEAFAAPVVVCNEAHRFLVAQQLSDVGVVPSTILLEPVGRNTAPAAAAASLAVQALDANGLALVLPTDHSIRRPDALRRTLLQAARVAGDAIVVFGVTPNRASTAYGYIRRGAALASMADCFEVERFAEKPPQADAQKYVDSGQYFWNSGIFLFAPDTFLNELRRLRPPLLVAVERAFSGRTRDTDFARLGAESFATVEAVSIDKAVMERTRKALLFPVEMAWSDLGSWTALQEESPQDDRGNVALGSVIAIDVRDSYLRAESGSILAAIGVRGLVVVVTDDAVLVADRNRADEVSEVVRRLAQAGRAEHVAHTTVYRSWGSYRVLRREDGFDVTSAAVRPGASIEMRGQGERPGHWVVLTGRATVHQGDTVVELGAGETSAIPAGVRYRVENRDRQVLEVVEVRFGSGGNGTLIFEESWNSET